MNDRSERESIGGQVPNPVAGAERYGAIEMANGDVVVYDQERPTAWLQSDIAVSPEA